jgi:uncharacterized protein YifN (PemK superfamily)
MKMVYAPQKGTILICNYQGLKAPEMDKLRPVVMLSSVSSRLVIVVPLSTTVPKPVRPWHYKVTLEEEITDYFNEKSCWAKCDMIMAVSFDRLSLPVARIDHGKRVYKTIRISEPDFEAVKSAAWRAISG